MANGMERLTGDESGSWMTAEVQRAMKHVRRMDDTCPLCGHPLYQVTTDGDTWSPGICTNVGVFGCPGSYRNDDGSVLQTYMQKTGRHSTATEDMAKRARWSDATNFMRGHSIYATSSMRDNDLNNWKAETPEQGNALRLAQSFVADVIAGKITHMILLGHTGAGKSHIANGTIKAIAKKSEFRRKVYFVSWPDFCAATKQGINKDAQDLRKKADRIRKAWHSNAVVVIDDLGAEDSTPFTRNLATEMAYALGDRDCIITTNQPWPKLIERYGERVTRRLLDHRDKYVIRLTEQYGQPIDAEQMRLLGM
ncbi:ATP-binding protein [Lacticaseibacillus sharpeae]|nr:ATP-binding protein [Lacticaseibacillus sharpeae]